MSKPKPKTKSRPKQVSKDAPARSEETHPRELGPPPPLTLEEAVDTWLLVLGIRGIDEGTHDFLPERVVGAIQETFMGFEGADRLTMALAFTRVVQNLLSSVGHLLEQAVASSGTSVRDSNTAEEVEVEVDEDDDDSSLYMQLGMIEGAMDSGPQEVAGGPGRAAEGDPRMQHQEAVELVGPPHYKLPRRLLSGARSGQLRRSTGPSCGLQ